MRCVARALCVTPVWRSLARYSYPPFHEENHAVLYRKIRAADYTFDEEYWSMVSDEAKDLIRKVRRGARRHDPRVKTPQTRAPGSLRLVQMLVVDPDHRLKAGAALRHPWFMKGDHELIERSLEQTLSTMRNFNAKRKLKGTIKTVMMANRIAKGTF